MSRPDLTLTVARRIFGWTLRAYPARIRAAHGDELRQTFAAAVTRARTERGRVAAMTEAAAECADVVRSGFAERRSIPRRYGIRTARTGGFHVVPTLLEWRRAARRLIAQPAYAAIVILALTLGIGANTVVFSVADAVLFRGTPYPNGARIVELFNRPDGRTFYPGLLLPVADEWRRHPDVFERVEGFNYGSFVVTSGAEPETLGGAHVTPGLFPMLGVRPALGRLFEPGEDAPGRNNVVILSHALWRRQFGGDPAAVGRQIVLDEAAYSIVGVMPRGFRFPAAPQQLWLPAPPPAPGTRNPRLQAVALLASGISEEMAQQRADAIAAGLQAAQPMPVGWGLRLMPFRSTMLNDTTRQAMRILVGAVALVLLIACANVANLFLAQALARDREIAIRAALGATRWRLAREMLAEGLVLAGIGGVLALVVAWWGVDAASGVAPSRITRFSANEIRLDGRALAFTTLVTVVTGLLFAILPAWRASRPTVNQALGGRTNTGGRTHGRLRATLVIGEVALSVVLLVGAALLIRSFARLQAVDVGFDPRNLLQVTLSLSAERYSAASRADLFRDLQKTVASMPGVRGVTTGDGLPADASIHFAEIEVAGKPPDGKNVILPSTAVAPDYFATLGLRIVAGRPFGPDDGDDVVIISESMARKYWPEGGALGSRMRLGDRDSWKTVVGVAGEVRQEHLQASFSEFEFYSPLWTKAVAPPSARKPAPGARMTPVSLFIRADDPMSLLPLIKQAVWRFDPRQPVENPTLAEHSLARSLAEQRFALTLMTAFAVLALVLAAAGLYAVLSQIVVQRRREIGVRVALGARHADVLRLIVARGMALTGLGVVVGIGAAYALSKYIRSQLYGTSATDPVSFGAVAAVMVAVALLACWIPTRRALKIDPAVALRAE